jgi:predicted pyridoxine 5'-phosphate oxidase superfamily flavin-nucleotide-binding protein
VAYVFHEGESELQRRAGVSAMARAVGAGIADHIWPAAARFLARQRLAIASSVDARGLVWASVLAGRPGFLATVDSGTLHAAADPIFGDPLADSLAGGSQLGLLVIDLGTRQRMRFNGRGRRAASGILLAVDEVYGNCPKYIQLRRSEPDAPSRPEPVRVREQLDRGQRAWIERADTLFLASRHRNAGADASHRGGFPGFVRTLGPTRVTFPDYPGNAMFNTLGNLRSCPEAGLTFVDFSRGHVLQLSGRASVEADFRVVFDVEEVRETRAASPLRFELVEYSPSNPSLDVTLPPAEASQVRTHEPRRPR